MAGLGLGLFFFVALVALLGQALRVNRRAGRLLALAGQLEAVLFSQVQQGRDTHPAPGFNASPSRADRSRIKITPAACAPIAEQLQARIVWVFAFNRHPHPRPFIAGHVGGDAGQGVGQQRGGNFLHSLTPR